MTNTLLQEELYGLQVMRNCEFPNIRRREASGNKYAKSKYVMYLLNPAEESINYQLEVYEHILRR
jgi:hypothetical protein